MMPSQSQSDFDSSGPTMIPAIPPPPGVTSNFVNPANCGRLLVVTGSVLVGIMVVFIAARAYTKTFITRKFFWDDLTCAFAAIGAIVYHANAVATVGGILGKHEWDLSQSQLLTHGFSSGFATTYLAPISLLFAKISFFLLYFQLFAPLRWVRHFNYFGATFTFCTYVALGTAQIIYCLPKSGGNRLKPSATIKQFTSGVPLSAMGLFIDLYILILPIVAVSQLQLARRNKIRVITVFMTGSIACLASVLSLYYRSILLHSSDLTWDLVPVVTLTQVEICVGVICASMPAVSCMMRHHLPHLAGPKSQFPSPINYPPSHADKKIGGSGLSPLTSVSGCGEPIKAALENMDSRNSTAPTHDLPQVRIVQTYITGGREIRVDDNKIHLRHDLEQHWS